MRKIVAFTLLLACLAGCASPPASSGEAPQSSQEQSASESAEAKDSTPGVLCAGFRPAKDPDYVYIVASDDTYRAVTADGRLLLTTGENCAVLLDGMTREQKYICLSRRFASDSDVTGRPYDFPYKLYDLNGSPLCDWQDGRLDFVWDDKGAVTEYTGSSSRWGINHRLRFRPSCASRSVNGQNKSDQLVTVDRLWLTHFLFCFSILLCIASFFSAKVNSTDTTA